MTNTNFAKLVAFVILRDKRAFVHFLQTQGLNVTMKTSDKTLSKAFYTSLTKSKSMAISFSKWAEKRYSGKSSPLKTTQKEFDPMVTTK